MTFPRRGHATPTWGECVVLVVLASLTASCDEVGQPAAPVPKLRNVAHPAPARGSASEGVPARASSRTDSQDPPVLGAGGGEQSPANRNKVRFVAIGDYGWSGPAPQRTAALVAAFQPDFVVTTGDNNYPVGAAATIDENIGQYYSELIYPYKGSYGSSATENRFFPTLGNHDWGTPGAAPYLDYFTLPGNERYYDIVRGDVHFFAIDSDHREPDGITLEGEQAKWLERELRASTSAFKVVAMHHPPYSSGPHGNTPQLQWPYAAWGADLVLAGHDHCYERLQRDGITYVVSGLGGASIYSFGPPLEGSVARYNDQYGVTILEADSRELQISFFDVDGALIDQATIKAR